MEDPQDRGPDRRADQEHEVDCDRRHELAGEHVAIADGQAPQELERPELPLLGDEPHRDERQHQQRHQAIVQEHVAPEPHRQVAAAEEHVEREVV
jgi:hypothetical protein